MPSQSPNSSHFGSQKLLAFFPPPVSVVEHDVTYHGIYLWSVGSAVLAVSPPSVLSFLSLLAAGWEE